ncbi:L,D-transpeptidase Cds6 family protein [Pseudoduganella aquatica]|uniref:Tetratricopeptide repeat protein n=1 Tax=Pseudoduganella aquatica TaxID=2660641 RepID=A0A7X4KQH4_9BURK|nr:tetratricopeptide repeat protein [Pseudoduganella aquatica]MYN11262.1 tetratricopeptide repeat protein [Pseudoduganella aquatica]
MIVKTAPNTLRRAVGNVCAGAGLLAALLATPAFADELADVTKLLRAGKASEALARTNAFLAKNPADPQMRFMKGVLLTEQNKSDEAIAIFTKLTEDYKDLPEPYNNLAVLYAASGQYDKARVALEKAIRTNPSYMTAYENLGDVYGKLASQAYDKALALGNGAPPATSKLTLLRTFSSSTGSKVSVSVPDAPAVAAARTAPPAVAAAAAPASSVKLVSQIPEQPKTAPLQRIPSMAVAPQTAPAAAKPAPAPVAAPSPVAVAAVPAKPVPAPAPAIAAPAKAPAPAPVVAAAPAKPVPAPVVAAAPAKPAPAPAPVAAATVAAAAAAKPAAGNAERDEVLSRVNGWAKAWATQDVNGYLGYYSNEFTPPKGASRKAWADERRARIEGKGRIRVEVNAPQVVITGDTAKVTFRQVYESDRLSANSRKTLVMVKHGGKWQIKQESSGS